MQNFTYHTHNHEQDFDGHQRTRQTRFRTRDRPLETRGRRLRSGHVEHERHAGVPIRAGLYRD